MKFSGHFINSGDTFKSLSQFVAMILQAIFNATPPVIKNFNDFEKYFDNCEAYKPRNPSTPHRVLMEEISIINANIAKAEYKKNFGQNKQQNEVVLDSKTYLVNTQWYNKQDKSRATIGKFLQTIKNSGLSHLVPEFELDSSIKINMPDGTVLSGRVNLATSTSTTPTPVSASSMPNLGHIGQKIEDSINDGRRQLILTGAPGTGKTYSVKDYCQNTGSEYKFVQFHPSYDYSDFVEGLRPVMVGGTMTFVKIDGVFKAFCRHIVENNIKKIPGNFNYDKIEKLFKDYDDFKDWQDLNTKYFFIIDEINRAELSKVFGELMYGLEESYRGVKNRFDTQYSKLPTYRDDLSGSFSSLKDDVFKNGFFIPENLIIIGTMNDIDRSVESFDFALRRRFKWIPIKANDVASEALFNIYTHQGKVTTHLSKLTDRIKALNKVISEDEGKKFGLNEDYHIGHAYFKGFDLDNVNDIATRQAYFDKEIKLILEEYVRGRRSGIEDFIEACRSAFVD